MVIRINRKHPAETPEVLAALLELRTSNTKQGRDLAKALRKLKDGKLKADMGKISVMAAILQLKNEYLKRTIMPYWAKLSLGCP